MSLVPARSDPAVAGWRFSRRLQRSPFAGELYAAELASLPTLLPHEYAQLADLELCCAEPVLLSWSQHYRLLAELVGLARTHWDAPSLLLVQHHAPNHIMPLPAELVAADVLLSHDPASLARQLRRSGATRLVVIEDELRRDGHETGRNVVSVSAYGMAGAPALLNLLRASPLARCGFAIEAEDLEPLP